MPRRWSCRQDRAHRATRRRQTHVLLRSRHHRRRPHWRRRLRRRPRPTQGGRAGISQPSSRGLEGQECVRRQHRLPHLLARGGPSPRGRERGSAPRAGCRRHLQEDRLQPARQYRSRGRRRAGGDGSYRGLRARIPGTGANDPRGRAAGQRHPGVRDRHGPRSRGARDRIRDRRLAPRQGWRRSGFLLSPRCGPRRRRSAAGVFPRPPCRSPPFPLWSALPASRRQLGGGCSGRRRRHGGRHRPPPPFSACSPAPARASPAKWRPPPRAARPLWRPSTAPASPATKKRCPS